MISERDIIERTFEFSENGTSCTATIRIDITDLSDHQLDAADSLLIRLPSVIGRAIFGHRV